MALTKQDVEAIGNVVDSKLDTRFTALESKIDGRLGAIDNKLGAVDSRLVTLEYRINETQQEIRGLREQIQQLTITLDNFVKMMTDYQEEFAILKAEVDQIKRIFKEKFGVEVAVQR